MISKKNFAGKLPKTSLTRSLTSLFALLGAFVLTTFALGGFRIFDLRAEGQSITETGPSLLVAIPIPEVCLVVAAHLLIYSFWSPAMRRKYVPQKLRNVLYTAAAIWFGLILAWNFAESLYRYIYRSPSDIFKELELLPGFLDMIAGTRTAQSFVSRAAVYVLATGIALGLGSLILFALSGSLRLALRRTVAVSHSDRPGAGHIARLILCFAALIGAAGQYIFIPDQSPTIGLIGSALRSLVGSEESLNQPLSGKLDSSVVGEHTIQSAPDNRKADSATPPPEGDHTPYALPRIKDGDVLLFVVESYGETVLSNASHRELMMPVYNRLAGILLQKGWAIRSGFLRSPVFGGRSWLADATLLSGVKIADERAYDAIMGTGKAELTSFFDAAGYHRILAAPGTSEATLRWKSFYDFDEYIFRKDFGYEGPFVSFGGMPDQFFLGALANRLTDRRLPRFMMAVTVSSHVPFEAVPRYLSDWQELGNGAVYSNQDMIDRFDNDWLSGAEYPQGYIASIEYTLNSIIGFLDEAILSRPLVIIIGDHQPRIPISEYEATYSVPVHLLHRDKSVFDTLNDPTFVEGLVPEISIRNHQGMETFPDLIRMLTLGPDAFDQTENMQPVVEQTATQ